jgi:ethanolamine utilization protein EutA
VSDTENKPKRHSLDDHMFGDFIFHEHGPEADHDHDDIDPGPLEENPIWQRDNVALSSVGIDIGSAGTQVVFSNIHLQRLSDRLVSKYVIVDRKTVYESPVSFTPFLDEHTIDSVGLGEIIDQAYNEADILPEDIDTGVVILTGEALRRENAESIASIISKKGGEFVTATAGNHMEAMLAAYGSGAAKASHDTGKRFLNMDIGGGTTKLALVEDGKVLWTAALHVGGRLIVFKNDSVTRIDPAGAHHARCANLDLEIGSPVTASNMECIAKGMADLLVRTITEIPTPKIILDLFLTDAPEDLSNLDGVMFSGGVAEYVYDREQRNFGDLGFYLGKFIRQRVEAGDFGMPLIEAGACIRATALGASEYSVQLSGQTSTISTPGKVLPRRNMQVLKPDLDISQDPNAEEIAAAIKAHYKSFDLDIETEEVALAFDWTGSHEYSRIRSLADGVVMALEKYIADNGTLYLMLDGDIALTLGGILDDELELTNELLVLDGITLRDFDYIDLGKIRVPSLTVPVTVKSLLFREDPRSNRKQNLIFYREDGADHDHLHHAHKHLHLGHNNDHDNS